MTINTVLTPLNKQLEEIISNVVKSPYLPSELRKDLEKEIQELSMKIQEGGVSLAEGEKLLSDLNKKATLAEIQSLLKKIGYLNPASPRLEMLRHLERQLNAGEVSSLQVRREMQQIMQI